MSSHGLDVEEIKLNVRRLNSFIQFPITFYFDKQECNWNICV